jgi:hypothetical protein
MKSMNRYFLRPDNGAILKFSNLPPLSDAEVHNRINTITLNDNGCKEISFWEYYKRFLGMSLNAVFRSSTDD